jgi:penicillin-binding protein 1A
MVHAQKYLGIYLYSKQLMMTINRPVLRFLTLSTIAGFFSLIIGSCSVYLYLAPSLPSVESLKNIQLQTPLRIFSSDQQLIAEFGEKRRIPVSFEEVPTQFYNALIAAEDENFYTHPGIDIKGLARAAYELITTGKKRSGGSTLTMQVAKNYYLSSEKTFTRKFTEILLALHIEQEISKKEILELYVNKVYLGKRAYGVASAAQVYYGKDIADLSLAQLAMIAGLPQAPSAANPINNPDRARHRRNYVLARMFTAGFISQTEFDDAGSEPISAEYHGLSSQINAPYVAEMVRSEMLKRYPTDLYTKGYSVTTTIDSKLQVAGQTAIRNGLHAFDRKHGLRQPLTQLARYVLPEQQELEVFYAPTNWSVGDPAPSEDKHIFLPPSPKDLNLNFWIKQSQKAATPGSLMWGIITAINTEKQSIELSLLDKTTVTLLPKHYQWAREFITINKLGPAITQVESAFKVGQKTLLQETNGTYWLAQEPATQASLVSFNPQNGALNALVGGYDFNRSKYNRSTQADRQPGSSFKPFVYSAGLEYGLTPASLINDAPVVFEDDSLEAVWRPENYSGKFFGPTRLRQALYKSRNLVSIRLLSQTGVGRSIRYISNLGIDKSKLNRDLSLALGSSGLTPFEMASAYNTLANGGHRVDAHFIQTIQSNEGETLYEHLPPTVCEPCQKSIDDYKKTLLEQTELETQLSSDGYGVENNNEPSPPPLTLEEFSAQFPPLAPRVMEKRVNYLMYTMLKDVIKRGTGKRALALNRTDLAGKTGTTNDQKDAWFSGFNNKIVANVWVGFDSPKTMGYSAFGSNTALPIWVEFMDTALEDMPDAPLKQPDGLVSVRIDPNTGNRAYPGQTNAIFEIFRVENIPKKMQQAPAIHNDSQSDSNDNEDDIPEQLF